MSESIADLICIVMGFNLDFAFMLQSGGIAKIYQIVHILSIGGELLRLIESDSETD